MTTTKTRWIVTHLPWKKQEALAIKRGWKKDQDGTSCWDWIEPEECEQEFGPYPNIEAAFAKAKKLVPLDTLGEPHVERQDYIPVDDYDDDPTYRWMTACSWVVLHDTERLDPDKPDHTYEAY